jgi:ribosomal-protein-alanine N-acetyltransferase
LPALTFEVMRPLDLRSVAELEKRAFADPWPASMFRRELGLTCSKILLARADGEIVGYVCRWLTADHVENQNVAVDPRWRRRSIARRLLEQVLDEARQAAVTCALLEVRSGNEAAITLYRDLGFEANGLRPRYYDDGEDALLMELRLDRDRG